MPADLSLIPDAELEAIARGDMSRLSDATLALLAGEEFQPPSGYQEPSRDVVGLPKTDNLVDPARAYESAKTWLPAIGGMAGSVVGGGGALVAGQMGPQIAAPEEFVTVPMASAAGGALGSAIGSQAADLFGEAIGAKERPKGIVDAAIQAGANMAEGVQGEALGLGIGAGVGLGVKGLAKAAQISGVGRAAPVFSSSAAEKEVARLLESFQQTGNPEALAAAQKLAEEIPGFKFTTGMGTGSRDLVSLERGAVAGSAQPGFEGAQAKAGEMLQGNIEAIGSKIRSMKTEAPLLSETAAKEVDTAETQRLGRMVDRQELGAGIMGAIEKAKIPIQKGMDELDKLIPDYTLPGTPKGDAKFSEILETKQLAPQTKDVIRSIQAKIGKEIAKDGKTIRSVQGARKALNQAITDNANDGEAQKLLGDIRRAYDEDLAEFGKLATSKGYAEVGGKVVNIKDLTERLDSLYARLGKAISQAELPPKDTKIYTYSWQKDTLPQSSQPNIDKIKAEITDTRKLLAEVSPAVDAAAALNAYNKYASEEWFGRFGTDTIKKLESLQSLENVPSRVMTPTAIDEYVKAVGKDESTRTMLPHYLRELSMVAEKGEKHALKWIRDNQREAGKLGILGDLKIEAHRHKGIAELKKVVGADPQSLWSSLMSGGTKAQRERLIPILQRLKGNKDGMASLRNSMLDYIEGKTVKEIAAGDKSIRNVAAVLKEMEPSLNLVFSEADKAALANVQKAAEMTQQFTRTSPAGGSQTAELLSAQRRLGAGDQKKSRLGLMFDAAIMGSAAVAGHFVEGAASVGARRVLSEFAQYGDQEVRAYFLRATFDPEYAKSLLKMSQQKSPKLTPEMKAQMSRVAGHLIAH